MNRQFINPAVAMAETALESNPYDLDAWNALLLRDVQNRSSAHEARRLHERLVDRFPTSARFWSAYLEYEMRAKNYETVGDLFKRCLAKVAHVSVWKLYVSYVRQARVDRPDYKELVIKAYDFALDKVGMDIDSFPLWRDYTEFLKSLETNGSYAQTQKLSATRKVYQRAISVPLHNIDSIWKSYCSFESDIDQQAGQKVQEEKGKDVAAVRKVLKDVEKLTRGLNKNAESLPPGSNPEEAKLMQQWREYISYEKKNPLRSDDQTMKRVVHAYEQFLSCFALHPEVWIEAAKYLEKTRKQIESCEIEVSGNVTSTDAGTLYERAIASGLESCLLVYFAYADMEEGRGRFDRAHSIYKRALDVKNPELVSPVYIQYMRFARRAEGLASFRLVFKQARGDSRADHRVYVAAAMTERVHGGGCSTAAKIFDMAFKKFGNDFHFVEKYLQFSVDFCDYGNTKALFERILDSRAQKPQERTIDLWNKFVEFERAAGSLASIMDAEEKRSRAFEMDFEGGETSVATERYSDVLPRSTAAHKPVMSYQANFPVQNAPPKVTFPQGPNPNSSSCPIPDNMLRLMRMFPPPPRHPPPPPSINALLADPPVRNFDGHASINVNHNVQIVSNNPRSNGVPHPIFRNGPVSNAMTNPLKGSKRKWNGADEEDEEDDEEGGDLARMSQCNVFITRKKKMMKI